MNNKPILEYEDVYNNYKYCVVFQPHGFRCGYVEIPIWHKMYKQHYDIMPVKCHGGLTYSENHLLDKEGNSWWVGFDCCHYDDLPDVESIKKYYYNEKHYDDNNFLKYCKTLFDTTTEVSSIKTLDFCISECKNIIDQLNNLP